MDRYEESEHKDKFSAFLYSIYKKTYIFENLTPYKILLDDAKQEYNYDAIFRQIVDMHESILDELICECGK